MNTEQLAHGPSDLVWVKSSYSGTAGGNCVEIAMDVQSVHVRDSTDRKGPHLSFDREAWALFLDFAATTRV